MVKGNETAADTKVLRYIRWPDREAARAELNGMIEMLNHLDPRVRIVELASLERLNSCSPENEPPTSHRVSSSAHE